MTDHHREQVEQAADRIRSDFLVTLSELDRRRDLALDPRYQVQQHAKLLIGIGIATAGLAALLGAWAVRRRNTRPRRRAIARRESLKRAWEHPERIASRAKERPAPTEVGRKLATAFAVTLGTQLAKRAALSLLPNPNADRQALRH